MTGEDLEADPATAGERAVATLTRFYPFNSGCGRLANSGVVGLLARRRKARVWAEFPGFRALVPMDDLVGRAIFFTGDLDPKVSWAARRFIRPGDVVLDVGANLGLMSLRMAQGAGRGGIVHAFEPNPRLVDFLRATLRANPGLAIRLHPVGLGRSNGLLPFHVPDGNAGKGSLVLPQGGGRVLTVEVRRLSDYCREAGIDRVDFIKMDVEGVEADVLEGGAEVIGRNRPRAILFEENRRGGEPASFLILRRLGYRLFALPKNLLRNRLVPVEDPEARSAHDFLALADAA